MQTPSWAGSAVLHAGGIAALLLLRQSDVLVVKPVLVTMEPKPKVVLQKVPINAGGGSNILPASRGSLPRRAELRFAPPAAKPAELEPALPMEPGGGMPSVDVAGIGLGVPGGVPGPPSSGPGKRPGAGGGDEGGLGGVYSIDGVSTAPVLIHKVEPEFSEEARKARYNGMVVLRVIIDEKGMPAKIEVLRSPGLGLDERAVRSVSQWRFRPGKRDGKPVRVWATVEVNFSLL